MGRNIWGSPKLVYDADGNKAYLFTNLLGDAVYDGDKITEYLVKHQDIAEEVLNSRVIINAMTKASQTYSSDFIANYNSIVNTPDGQIAYYYAKPVNSPNGMVTDGIKYSF